MNTGWLAGTDVATLVTILSMTVVSVVTRCFFFISRRPWSLPAWAERGLAYAPIAALAAVIIPEMVMTGGELTPTWQDARLFAVAAGAAWFYLRRSLFGTIIAGMAVYLPLRLALCW